MTLTTKEVEALVQTAPAGLEPSEHCALLTPKQHLCCYEQLPSSFLRHQLPFVPSGLLLTRWGPSKETESEGHADFGGKFRFRFFAFACAKPDLLSLRFEIWPACRDTEATICFHSVYSCVCMHVFCPIDLYSPEHDIPGRRRVRLSLVSRILVHAVYTSRCTHLPVRTNHFTSRLQDNILFQSFGLVELLPSST